MYQQKVQDQNNRGSKTERTASIAGVTRHEQRLFER